MSRFDIFRDWYERIEYPTRRWSHRFMEAGNWPETKYALMLLIWDFDRTQGKRVTRQRLLKLRQV